MSGRILSAALAASLGFGPGLGAGAASAAELDLAALGYQIVGGPIASSSAMSISDTAPIDMGAFTIPGFFQALDTGADPTLELNTGDGSAFNLAFTPGTSGVSVEVAQNGARELQFLFDLVDDGFAYGVFVLAEGDDLSMMLTGASFEDASMNVWAVEAVSAAVPVPAAGALLLGALGVAGAMGRRRG